MPCTLIICALDPKAAAMSGITFGLLTRFAIYVKESER